MLTDLPHKVLIVLHQERSTPGRVGQMLVERGFTLDVRRPALGDPLPETLAQHAGAVVFGGPMSANDRDEFVRLETEWMSVPLKEDKPLLGICLGAQMLVNNLGGRVGPRDDGGAEIGWYKLQATDAGSALMNWPDMVYHFHTEGFSLPWQAQLLATSEAFPNQAFRYGRNAWGVQFHAELTLAMMARWSVRGAAKFGLPGAQLGAEHLAGRLLWDAPLRRWLGDMLDLSFGRLDAPSKALALAAE